MVTTSVFVAVFYSIICVTKFTTGRFMKQFFKFIVFVKLIYVIDIMTDKML